MTATTEKSGDKAEPQTVEEGTPSATDDRAGIAEDNESTEDVAAGSAGPGDRPAPQRRGLAVLAGLVLGGIIAAGIGFYAARYLVPEGWPFPGVTSEPDPLAVEQTAQGERIAALEERVPEALKAISALQDDETVQALAARLDEVEGQLSEIRDLLEALDTRILGIEKIPRGSGAEAAEAAAAAYERELTRMRAMLAEELARIEAAQSEASASGQNAAASASHAVAQAALAQIRSAQDSGQKFAGALRAFSEATGRPVPEILTQAAQTGVATLPQLQETFPAAARAALDASIAAAVADGSMGRLTGFLRSQLGARSLEPREGDDPDAILSRAEGALKHGQIARALQEIATLPEAGRAGMADWVQQAQTRLEVLAATDLLTDQLNQE